VLKGLLAELDRVIAALKVLQFRTWDAKTGLPDVTCETLVTAGGSPSKTAIDLQNYINGLVGLAQTAGDRLNGILARLDLELAECGLPPIHRRGPLAVPAGPNASGVN
jgi:hypothetical protein